LHLHNHKRSSCHIYFNPNVLKDTLPNANTMICDQGWKFMSCSLCQELCQIAVLASVLACWPSWPNSWQWQQFIIFHPYLLQTFTWLGRFKKILNSLPKHRFDFMLHRLIIHRNRYTEYCHSHKKYPLLPSMKPTKKT